MASRSEFSKSVRTGRFFEFFQDSGGNARHSAKPACRSSCIKSSLLGNYLNAKYNSVELRAETGAHSSCSKTEILHDLTEI